MIGALIVGFLIALAVYGLASFREDTKKYRAIAAVVAGLLAFAVLLGVFGNR